ncbi:RNA polymerase subunit sigma-70 [Microbacterium panaciterrae]|uniref:Sigma-70 family RNA polymerase sigma factor n=1 Tax=Microbacterium panaciterrae TaxID=985759 RepID=A0ABP8PI31_9MICO
MNPSDLAALRGGLLAFCYQMMGSPFDAEDAVQDALERAWRARESYDPAVAALSTWVYRIARNVCVDRLRETPRRPLPRDLTDPGIDVGAPLVPALDVPWLMPAPSSWWGESEPERAVAEASGVRLAVTLVLQALPPKQRGVFILRDVLGHSAGETAEILEASVASVNSALQRARTAVAERSSRPAPLRRETVERYARAIEQGDAATLATLVADDVLFEMPPVPYWSIGRETYAAFMRFLFEWQGTRWQTRPISANGQHGILLLHVTDEGAQPHTVQLFEADASGKRIGHVLVYRDEALFALFEREGIVADEFASDR